MDKQTSKTLQKINMQEAMARKDKFAKEEDLFETEREALERQLKNPNATSEQRKRIKLLLANEQLHTTKLVINEETTKEIESNVERRIKTAIKQGKIKPAKRDAFIRRQEAWAKRDVKTETEADKYKKFMENTLRNKKFTESWQRVEAEKKMIKYGKEQGYL